MEKQIMKKKILRSAIRKHQDLIEEFKKKISHFRREETAVVAGDSSTRYPGRSSDKIMHLLNEQLQFIHEEMNVLNNLASSVGINSEVVPGSVVVTNHGIFFISAYVDSFCEEGNMIHCISENSTFYFQVAGKRIGDEFFFNNLVYQILDIY
jgi:hypothetical protein